MGVIWPLDRASQSNFLLVLSLHLKLVDLAFALRPEWHKAMEEDFSNIPEKDNKDSRIGLQNEWIITMTSAW